MYWLQYYCSVLYAGPTNYHAGLLEHGTSVNYSPRWGVGHLDCDTTQPHQNSETSFWHRRSVNSNMSKLSKVVHVNVTLGTKQRHLAAQLRARCHWPERLRPPLPGRRRLRTLHASAHPPIGTDLVSSASPTGGSPWSDHKRTVTEATKFEVWILDSQYLVVPCR